MIDFTNRETLITVKVALIRALNSLDNDIADIDRQIKTVGSRNWLRQAKAKLDLLDKSRDDMRAIYNEIDKAIEEAS